MAAADAGQYGTSPPKLLGQAWDLHRWGALPEAGGLLDQPAGLLKKMATLENVYDTFRGLKTQSNVAKWLEGQPERGKLIQTVMKLRVKNDQ